MVERIPTETQRFLAENCPIQELLLRESIAIVRNTNDIDSAGEGAVVAQVLSDLYQDYRTLYPVYYPDAKGKIEEEKDDGQEEA